MQKAKRKWCWIFLSEITNPLRTLNNAILNSDCCHVFDISETQGLCGRAHGGEAGDGFGGNRGGSWQETRGERLRQGICSIGSVSGAEEGRGVVSGLVERHVRREHQTAGRLLRLPARVVRLLPVESAPPPRPLPAVPRFHGHSVHALHTPSTHFSNLCTSHPSFHTSADLSSLNSTSRHSWYVCWTSVFWR